MLFGIPGHGPLSRSKTRSTPGERLGGPNPAGKLADLVSTSRHGATPMNARGGVKSAIVDRRPEADAAVYGGTVQLETGIPGTWERRAVDTKPVRRTESRVRIGFLQIVRKVA
jgi:hypothetical protein